MSRAGCQKRSIGGLEHQSHAGRNSRQARNPFRTQQSGIRMREQIGFAEHQFAHGLKIMESGFVSQPAQGLAHFRKCEFGFIAETEESLGASHLLARARHRQYLVRGHGVCAGLAGIAAEGAIAAVVATEVGERNKNLARIGNDAGLKRCLASMAADKQRGKIVVRTADQLASIFSRKRHSGSAVRLHTNSRCCRSVQAVCPHLTLTKSYMRHGPKERVVHTRKSWAGPT